MPLGPAQSGDADTVAPTHRAALSGCEKEVRLESPDYLRRLNMSSHKLDGAKVEHHCSACGKAFSRREQLQHHQRTCTVVTGSQAKQNPSPSRSAPGPAPSTTATDRRPTGGAAVETTSGTHRDDPNTGSVRRSREQNAAAKRGRYVSNACVNCQKRKVKCTGEEVCQQCRAADLPCTYNLGKKRRKVIEARDERLTHPAPEGEANAAGLNLSESLFQMMTRISVLEHDCSFLRTQLHRSQNRDPSSPGGSLSHRSPSEADEDLEPPADNTFQGPTNMLNPIGVLTNTVAGSDGSPSRSARTEDPVPQSAFNWREISRSDARVMKTAELDTKFRDTARMDPLIATFFEQINPYYPSVNENELKAQIAELLASSDTPRCLSKPDRYQVVALVNLIIAEVRLLSDEWMEAEAVPGWANFWRAERILSCLAWQGNGNRLTVQCLIIKGRYLMNLEHRSAAHESICRAVRLCFQLGFHDTSSWSTCSPFEVVMRTRIFWTVFYLERGVALNCGYPYIIRETDIKVPLPAAYNDQDLYPDRPLPYQAIEERSYAPNLIASVKWSRLTAEIWDTMFAANHPPINPEFIASMDARILYCMNQLSTSFQRPVPLSGAILAEQAPFIQYQWIIQRLRHQQLRLLLRQDSLLTLDYDDATAVECQEIIQSTLHMLRGPSDVGDVPVGRLAVVFYIVVTLLPLICLINGRRATQACPDAIACFKAEIEMLHQLAPSVGMARHVLSNMHDIITATKNVIQASHDSLADAYPFYPYPKSIEPSAFIPPEPLQTQGEFGNIVDEILANPSLLQLVALPSDDPQGLWVGDTLSEQWMQMSGH